MAFNTSTLVNYVIENENLLVIKSIFGGKTADLIREEGTVMTGVKFAEQINVLDTDAIFQTGDSCTRVSSGTTSITQRKVTVGAIAVVEDICVKDLRKTFQSKAMVKGSNENTLPFEVEYTTLKARVIAKQVEIALWQGDTTSGNANLSRFDGLIKQIDASGVAIVGNIGNILVGTGITSANVKGIVDNMWQQIPADVKGQDNIRIFCGWDTFSLYIGAFRDQNLFNFAPPDSAINAANGEVIIPGTTHKLTAVHGLDGTNRLFTMRMSNLFEATDIEDEFETNWSIMEDQFKDYLRFKAQFKMGINVAFPAEIVSFKLN